jgi:hypothetical protein
MYHGKVVGVKVVLEEEEVVALPCHKMEVVEVPDVQRYIRCSTIPNSNSSDDLFDLLYLHGQALPSSLEYRL